MSMATVAPDIKRTSSWPVSSNSGGRDERTGQTVAERLTPLIRLSLRDGSRKRREMMGLETALRTQFFVNVPGTAARTGRAMTDAPLIPRGRRDHELRSSRQPTCDPGDHRRVCCESTRDSDAVHAAPDSLSQSFSSAYNDIVVVDRFSCSQPVTCRVEAQTGDESVHPSVVAWLLQCVSVQSNTPQRRQDCVTVAFSGDPCQCTLVLSSVREGRHSGSVRKSFRWYHVRPVAGVRNALSRIRGASRDGLHGPALVTTGRKGRA